MIQYNKNQNIIQVSMSDIKSNFSIVYYLFIYYLTFRSVSFVDKLNDF